MIRRIGVAGAGLWAILLPACMSTWNPSEPYFVDTNTGQPVAPPKQVVMNRLPGTTVQPGQSPYGRIPVPTRIADGQFPIVQTGGTGLVDAKIVDAPADLPEETVKPKERVRLKDEIAFSNDLPKSTVVSKPPVTNTEVIYPKWPSLGYPQPVETTSSAKPAESVSIEPVVPDRQPKLTPNDPNLTKVPNPLPSLEGPQPLQPNRIQPQSIPPLESPKTTPVSANETVLVRAIRSFQNNRPEEAVETLKQLDPTNQDVLIYLMPLMVRLGDGSTQNLPPEELAALVDRLQQATAMLKAKAALRLDRVSFCKAVRKFGDVDTFDARHEFRPGDRVYLYMEIRNFTCEAEAVKPASGTADSTTARRNYLISIATRLEICDAQGRSICNYDLRKEDHAHTPPQDYYHTYGFNVPDNLTPGNYTLWITVADKNKPNSPPVRQPIELRVGRAANAS